MPRFRPCLGQNVCRDDGTRCLACHRSLAEIARTRDVIDNVTAFLEEFAYDNPEEFIDYLTAKVKKKLKARRTNE